MNLSSHLLDGDLLALELADGDGLDGLPEPLPPGAEGHDVLRRVDHALNLHNDEFGWNVLRFIFMRDSKVLPDSARAGLSEKYSIG